MGKIADMDKPKPRYGPRRHKKLTDDEKLARDSAHVRKTARGWDGRRESKALAKVRWKPPDDWPKLISGIPGFDPYVNPGPYTFDEDLASEAVRFFPDRLVHVRGKPGHPRFYLEDWQAAIVANLYGWVHPKTGIRRFRECYGSVARKNGKTTMGAGLVVRSLIESGEMGAEIYSAAGQREQASLVLAPAREMALQNKWLGDRLQVHSRAIFKNSDPLTSYKPICAEAQSAHGYNPVFVVLDELHTQPDADLYEALKTGMGARQEPLMLSITTAGYDKESICFQVYEYAKGVRDGTVDNPRFLPAIWEVGPDEDWTDEAIWHKANPNLGVSVSLEFLRDEFKRARQQPRFENAFKRLYLNMWTEQLDRWITQAMWERNGGEVPESAYIGKPCWGGLDLSMSRDLSAFVLVWKLDNVNYVCKAWHFLPMGECQNLHDRGAVDHVNYEPWVRQGFVEVMESFSTDYAVIRRRILDCCKRYRVQDIGYDRAHAADLVHKLEDDDGIKMVDIGQGTFGMSAPSKEFDRLLGDGHFKHQDNPVLRWMAANVVLDVKEGDLIKPSKDKTRTRIDGIVAAIMALSRSLDGKAPAGPAAAPVFIR